MATQRILFAMTAYILLTQPVMGDEDAEQSGSEMVKLILAKNDPHVRPGAKGSPVVVKCTIMIDNIGAIDEINMDFEVDVYFQMSWADKRLKFSESDNSTYHIVRMEAINNIWLPDLHFVNAKKGSFHDVTVPNKVIWAYPNGTVLYSVRLSLKLSCLMDLSSFPMDKQTCHIKIESYGYEKSDMLLEWREPDPILFDDDMFLAQFTLGDVQHQTECVKQYNIGEFECLKATIVLHREFGFFLLQTYIPSMLIVILSWISFWLSTDAVAARTSLGVTTILTMATQLSGSKESIPKVSYPKAIDIWMTTCMAFVFAALLEYAVVNSSMRNVKKTRFNANQNTDETYGDVKLTEMEKQGRAFTLVWLHQMDKVCRVLFPGLFIAFNIVYWAVYMNWSHQVY